MFLSEPAASWLLAAQRCSMKSTCSEVFQWVVSLTSSSLWPWHQSSRAGCGGACTVLLHRSVPSITYVFDWSARFSSHVGQSVPLSSSSRLRTRNKLLRSTGFLAPACPHTEGFMVASRVDSDAALPRTLSDVRLQSLPAETALAESHSEPLLQISNAGNSSNMQFLRDASKVSIPAPIAEMLS